MVMTAAVSWKKGGCHCGAVRFEVLVPDDIEVLDCNCSICAMTGYLHLIVPKERFRLLAGEDALSHYEFNTRTAKHMFCSNCGIKSFYLPRSHPDSYSVNARCLEPSAIRGMHVTPFDGQNWERHMSERLHAGSA
jgi:centromere protein V